MTTLIVRPPLQLLSMSSAQSGSRRQSARLQDKDVDVVTSMNAPTKRTSTTSIAPTKVQLSTTNARKRKNNYDEDDDGFVFSRGKKQKSRQQEESTVTQDQPPPSLAAEPDSALRKPRRPSPERSSPQKLQRVVQNVPLQDENASTELAKKKRKRMSFSTPAPKAKQPVRRSKRLSAENQADQQSPLGPSKEILRPAKNRKERSEKQASPIANVASQAPYEVGDTTKHPPSTEEEYSSTKIALPFADTPVISRNKAMREGKSGKGERRSSLGLRGRRASSLIDSGTSSALPHSEVAVSDFYKHIESDLLEPRRMRQLLTWCGTRAMHPKIQGSTFEEASAKAAARVIEEELLKDLHNKADLSDWFSRDDAPGSVAPLPERPNPKNVQNGDKIAELEAQIERLKVERHALEALLDPPAVSEPQMFEDNLSLDDMDLSFFSPSEIEAIQSLQLSSSSTKDLTDRLQTLTANLQPAIDTFADGIHKITQYQNRADTIASQVLSLCADKLAEREREGRKKALGMEGDQSPGRDLNSVLRGLSKAKR